MAPSHESERSSSALDRRLHPERLDASDAEPVFVLGSVRSGTSIAVRALREGAGIPGFLEGNVLSLLQRMLDEVARQFDMTEEYLADRDSHLISNVDREGLENYIVNYFVSLYLRHHGPGRWVDKSPESYLTAPMIRSAPLLLEIFPKARFVFCIRRPIENILSKQRKFPGLSFKHYCRSWTDAVHYWGEFRNQHQGCFLELRQETMALEPDRVASELAGFLHLDEAAQSAMAEVFSGPRVEQTQSAQEHRFLGIDETPWSWEEKAEFIELVGPFLPATGYGLEAKLLRSGTLRLFFPNAEGAIEIEGVADDAFSEPTKGELQLIPPNDGSEARVRYLGITFSGQRSFEASLHLPASAREAVIFGIELTAEDGESIRNERRLEIGETAQLGIAFDQELIGAHDVVLTTRLAAPAGAAPAEARFRNPEFR